MEVRRQEDQRHVDHGQAVGEPVRQEDVGDGTIVGTERFGHIGERTTETIRGEDHALAAHHRCRDRDAPIGPPHEPRIQQVPHARFDGEPGRRMDDLDRDERALMS